jgi:hypothetical protein
VRIKKISDASHILKQTSNYVTYFPQKSSGKGVTRGGKTNGGFENKIMQRKCRRYLSKFGY